MYGHVEGDRDPRDCFRAAGPARRGIFAHSASGSRGERYLHGTTCDGAVEESLYGSSRGGADTGSGSACRVGGSVRGAWVTPGIYEVNGSEAFLTEELFGPHVSFEVAQDAADAFRRAADTPYGLSAALFSASDSALEDFYDVVRAGVINFNRSTNGASGLLPFGGTGMSGNWRAAGSCAPRLSTYPVAFMKAEFGHLTPHPGLEALLN